jgi:hypothetical protein
MMASTTIFGQNLFFTEDTQDKKVRELTKKALGGDEAAYMEILKTVDERLDKELPLTPTQKTVIGKMRLKTPSWSSSQDQLTKSFAQEVITKITTSSLRDNFESFCKNLNLAEESSALVTESNK